MASLPISTLSHNFEKKFIFDSWIGLSVLISLFVLVFLFITLTNKVSHNKYKEDDKFETMLTVGTFTLLVGFWVPKIMLLIKKQTHQPSAQTLLLKGNQWYWECDSDLGSEIFKGWYFNMKNSNYLNMQTTSKDVIHSVGIRGFGTLDAVPGRMKNSVIRFSPGVKKGNCMELCGVGHSHMPFYIIT